MTTVAVLFARADSIYKTIPCCDVWDIKRDARKFPGGYPVIAHPPCRAWGQLSHMAKPRADEKMLAVWAVEQVRKYGGVLEHPRASKLWWFMPLPRPGVIDKFGGFTLPVWQYWWGHRARKASFFYICGILPKDIPDIPFLLGDAEYCVSTSGRRKDGTRSKLKKEIRKSEREHTPKELAYWLVNLAMKTKPRDLFLKAGLHT